MLVLVTTGRKMNSNKLSGLTRFHINLYGIELERASNTVQVCEDVSDDHFDVSRDIFLTECRVAV